MLDGDPGDDWLAGVGDSPTCAERLGEWPVGVVVSADAVDRVVVGCDGLDLLPVISGLEDNVRRKDWLEDVLDDWLGLRDHEEVVPLLVVPEVGVLDVTVDAVLQFDCPLGDVLVCEAAGVWRSWRDRNHQTSPATFCMIQHKSFSNQIKEI